MVLDELCARLTPRFPRREWAGQVAVRNGRPFLNTPFLAVGLAFRTEKFAILEIETLYFLATNVERRFRATRAGAVGARRCWTACRTS
jgi:hypothetical protein